MCTCNESIQKAMRIAKDLMILANEGYASMEDDGCGVLFGVVRDCAHKIRAEAEREREAHKARGVWEEHKTSAKDTDTVSGNRSPSTPAP